MINKSTHKKSILREEGDFSLTFIKNRDFSPNTLKGTYCLVYIRETAKRIT